MDFSFYANIALFSTFAFILVAAIGDTVATRQIAFQRYRFIPLVRLLRKCQVPAVVSALVFGLLAFALLPTILVVLVVSVMIFVVISQIKSLVEGYIYTPLMRVLLPGLLLTVLGAWLLGLPLEPKLTLAMHLPASSLACLVLAAFGFWYVARQRTHQDYLRRMD